MVTWLPWLWGRSTSAICLKAAEPEPLAPKNDLGAELRKQVGPVGQARSAGRPIEQPGIPVLLEAPLPAVEGLAAHAVTGTEGGHRQRRRQPWGRTRRKIYLHELPSLVW